MRADDRLLVTYADDEGDNVAIDCDSALREAIDQALTNPSLLTCPSVL